MEIEGLDRKLIGNWLAAADDLGIRVTALVALTDAAGQPFLCEAFVHDFMSPAGGVVASAKTERRVRQQLRGLGGRPALCVTAGRASYVRKYAVDALVDWGWFGAAGEEPDWYRARVPHSG